MEHHHMAHEDKVYDVVIVGGGPVGTLLAIELGRRNHEVLLIERRESRLRHPRAVGIHARTLEIFRQLGYADDIRKAGGLPLEDWSTFGYLTRLTKPDIGAIDLWDDEKRVADARVQSPEMIGWCSQELLEPFLRKKLAGFPNVTVGYGLRATGVEQDDSGVTITAFDEATGKERTFRGKYLAGADGGRSTVRDCVGIDAPETGVMGYQLNVSFEADLSPYIGDRKYVIYWIINSDTQGAFLTYDGKKRWIYSWGYDPNLEGPEDYSTERLASVVRSAIGTEDVDVEIEGVFSWRISAALSDKFRTGKVFLVGDAAHRFPPSGGFGMNSGLQDAHNLAWKLDLVLNGHAGDALLDTYDTERHAVAVTNTNQTIHNAELSADVGWFYDPAIAQGIEGPNSADIQGKIAAAIPSQEAQYWSSGQQFGVIYESDAVIPDGTVAPKSSVMDYVPSASPGARAPHVWLRGSNDERVSTIDLLHSRFVVLATPDGQAWIDATKRIAAEHGADLGAFTIGTGGDFTPEDGVDWAKAYGLSSAGVVIVRPDGHVAFRAQGFSDRSADEILSEAFGKLMSVEAVLTK
jgi:putative polyketide hydroxylase